MSKSTCNSCGEAFTCDINRDGDCWCFRVPNVKLPMVSKQLYDVCLCPVCLTEGLVASETDALKRDIKQQILIDKLRK